MDRQKIDGGRNWIEKILKKENERKKFVEYKSESKVKKKRKGKKREPAKGKERK